MTTEDRSRGDHAPSVAAPPKHYHQSFAARDACESCMATIASAAALRAESVAAPVTGDLRERLLAALKANAYRGAWHSDRAYLMPMGWDEDDAVDRIIEDAALAAAPPALPPKVPEDSPYAEGWNAAIDVMGEAAPPALDAAPPSGFDWRGAIAEQGAKAGRAETAAWLVIKAMRDDVGRCRLCGAIESQVHLPDCAVAQAVAVMRPDYLRAATPASGEPARVMAPGDYDIGANDGDSLDRIEGEPAAVEDDYVDESRVNEIMRDVRRGL